MSIRPPKALAPKKTLPDDPLSAALEHEILAEKAGTYARLLKRLEEALAKLRAYEEAWVGLPLTADPRPSASGLGFTAHGDSARDARGPALARPNGRASMASRPPGGSSAIRHGLSVCPDSRPEEGKRDRAPAGQAAPAEARPQDGIAVSENKPPTNSEHEALLNAAGEALWHVVIQRDLCGFRRHELFYKELNIPAAVRYRMGLVTPRLPR